METVVERTVIATPTPIPVQQEVVEAKVQRVIYGLGEVNETNRHWTVGRPSYYQFDPYSETLVGLDAVTNERIPRLAKNWESTPRRPGMDLPTGGGRSLPLRLWRFHISADVVASY